MTLKRKFTLEFDEVPALVFVQRKSGLARYNNTEVYVDGEKVSGLRAIRILAGIDEFTTHEIEYVTGCTKKEA